MSKIAIDADGVICRFHTAFLREANRIWPGKVDEKHEPTSWDDFDGLTHDEMSQVWSRIKATPNWWMTLDAYSDSVGALAIFLWTQRNHDIWIVTSRVPTLGSSVAFQTDTWLRACGVSQCSNYLGVFPVDAWHDKRKIYKYAQIEFSIDDKKETVEACDTLEGHQAFLLDRPWNKDAQVKRRVKSVQEYLDAIKQA